MEQNKGFWYADWSFPIFVGLLSSGVFAGTHMYYLYGIGAFNEVAFVAMLKSGIDTGVYGAVAAFGASFLFARIIEGSLVGILDIGGAIQTGIGLGVPALLLGAGFVFPVANFAASLVTGLVLGLAVGYIIILARKFTINQSDSTYGADVMMGAGNASGRFLGPLIILSAMTASIPIGIGSLVGALLFYICRARLVDDTLTDIAIQDGKIAALGEISAPSRKTIELNGKVYVSAGWIDSHVHCYPNSPIYHDEPDSVGIATGVTTVIDAGSTGADDVDDFYQLTRKAATEVYALLNISRVGLIAQNELANMANIDAAAVKQAVQRHPDFIVGLKARMSSSVVGENGITPLARAKAIQQENDDLPLMVHIGNNPPNLDEIADLLSSGDIITHCYNGKPNRILNPAGELRSSITRALQRGVRLDVGHGTASFSFEVARRAIALGILPHTISSDIYCRNRIDGPVRSLALVMSKFLAIGMTLPQVIDCVTVSAAEGLRLSRKGRLEVGFDADLTLFRLEHRPTLLVDAEKESLQADNILVPLAAIRAGKGYLTEQGSAEHAFDF
ncbi:MAG: amidohydrolase/deacetylase family metallohydrolase [Klebsiella pneumoniae]|nr:amidohydrolase/deacetylase family metallohydrolase [Klebsiella pneumoniae]